MIIFYQQNTKQMKRLEELMQSQNSKPKQYHDIKQNPRPYLQNANRTHIFEFIYQLQKQNEMLLSMLQVKYPQATYEQAIEKANIIQINQKLVNIHQQSIQKIEIQIIDKMAKIQHVKIHNQQLQKTSQSLQAQFQISQKELIEVQKQRRTLQLQQRLRRQKRQRINISGLLSNLYKQAKSILQE